MKRIFAAALCLLPLFGMAQKQALTKQVIPLLPKGYVLSDTAFGDLNADGKMDVIAVLRNVKDKDQAERGENDTIEYERPMLLFTQGANGKLKQEKRNDKIIMCSSCGGMMGDPYQGITIKNNGFTVAFYGGSSWRWATDIVFARDAARSNWVLVKEKETSFQSGDPENTMSEVTIPGSELPDLTIDNYAGRTDFSETEVPLKVVADKCYFYTSPVAGTKRKAYVLKNDKLSLVRELKTFYEVNFVNTKEQVTSGYVLKKDVVKTK